MITSAPAQTLTIAKDHRGIALLSYPHKAFKHWASRPVLKGCTGMRTANVPGLEGAIICPRYKDISLYPSEAKLEGK